MLSGNRVQEVKTSTLFSDAENAGDTCTPKVTTKHVYAFVGTEMTLKKLKLLQEWKMN